MKKRISLSVFLLVGLLATQFYQNCAPIDKLSMGSEFSAPETIAATAPATSVDAPGVHPTDSSAKTSTRKIHIVSKDYVAEIFQEVFTSTKYPVSNLEGLIDKWVRFKGAQYGGACDMYSSFSLRDCNGSVANTDLPYFTDGNTVRESFRIQMCENVLGLDNGITSALEKAGLTVSSTIDQNSIGLTYQLFYRANAPEELSISTLLELNKTLEASSVSLKERWRAVLTQICESPGWQLY